MQTVAMNKDYIRNTYIGMPNEKTDIRSIQISMGRSNFLLGSTLPEHNRISMVGIQKPQVQSAGNPPSFKGQMNFQQSGAGVVNPAS